MNENPSKYFKRYRESIGFSNQQETKQFLAGKDIVTAIDFDYINSLNKRLSEIIIKLNSISDVMPGPF